MLIPPRPGKPGPSPPFPELPSRPTREQVAAAEGATVPDLIRPGLDVLFCGINPSLYSAAVGHHFARPGNRFWPALHASGFTPRLLSPFEGLELMALGLGITNVVDRASASAAEVSKMEFIEGGRRLEDKVSRFRPTILAILGITAYRTAFDCKDAVPGRQSGRIGGAAIWVLPNPSGRNGHFSFEPFRELRGAVNRTGCASR